MRIEKKHILLAAAVAACPMLIARPAMAQNFLSVDINGGNDSPGNTTNEGFSGGTVNPVTDASGQTVTFQPFSGRTDQGGDGVLLPTTPNPNTPPYTPITRTYNTGAVASGAITVSIGAGSLSGGLSSRDRIGAGVSTGSGYFAAHPEFHSADNTTGTFGGGSANLIDLYRDFIFTPRDGNNRGLGSNPLIITLTGLDANKTYNFTGYAFDNNASGYQMFGSVDPSNFQFQQDTTIGTTYVPPPNPLRTTLSGPSSQWTQNFPPESPGENASIFKITADSTGTATIYTFASVFGPQGATVLNGLQVGSVAQTAYTANAGNTWGGGGQPTGSGTVANFFQQASPTTVTLESSKTVGVMTLASTNGYTFNGTGTTLTFDTPDPAPYPFPPASGIPLIKAVQLNVLGAAAETATHTINVPVVLNANLQAKVGPGADSLIINGGVSGTGSFAKLGDGNLFLNGNNTYTGVTAAFGGHLYANGNNTGGGTFIITNGTVFGGVGTVSSNVNITNNAHIGGGTPGTNSGVGTFTVSSLTLDSAQGAGAGTTAFDVDLGAGGADRVNVTTANGLAFNNTNGTVTFGIRDAGGITNGQFVLLDYNGAIFDLSTPATPVAATDPFSRFFLLNPNNIPGTFTLVNNTANTSIDLLISGVVSGAANSIWNNPAGGNWSLATNWTPNQVPNAVDATANFNQLGSGPINVNVDSPQTVGSINFNSTNSYTISGSTLTLDVSTGSASITNANGNHTISSQLAINDNLNVTVTNAANTLTVNNIRIPTGGLTKSGAGTLKIAAGATPNLAAGTSKVKSLSLSAGKLDLTNNSMAIDYDGSVGTQLTTIRSALSAGTLFTSSATSLRRLGYADNNTLGASAYNSSTKLFAGQGVDATSVLIKYTFNGDADLNGAVDVADFTAFFSNFGAGSGATWQTGDFDYNGAVDVADFTLFFAAFGQSGLAPTAAMIPFMNLAGVPEPTSLAMIGLGGAALIARRRRIA